MGDATIAPTNEEAADAWGGVLFDRWLQFRDVVTTQISPFSEEALRLYPPPEGGRALDIGCGLGDTTTRIAELIGPDGEAVGIDVGDRFIDTARTEAAESGIENVSYLHGDVQVADLGGPYDYAFSRFGTMFFANPVAALRNVRQVLAPGGRLCMIVWRRKLDNEWLHRGERVVEGFLAKPEETDEPTCGPGPFSMANADTTTDILINAGYEDIAMHRCDIAYKMGDDLDKAIELVTAIGPAGELIRLATADADEAAAARARAMVPDIEAALREAYAELATEDGTRAQASAWIVGATAPASLARALDQLDPVVVRVADEAQARAALADAVRRLLRLDPDLGEALEGCVEVVDGECDVAVARADVVWLGLAVVEGELEAVAVAGEAHEDVGGLVADGDAAALLEAELLVELNRAVDVGDPVAGVDEFGGHAGQATRPGAVVDSPADG